jgi:hypothetical protein
MTGAEYSSIQATHSDMSKFESKNSQGYTVVAEAIKRYAGSAREVVQTRWKEEKKARHQRNVSHVEELFSHGK